ncbi:response regulator transcription factor [Acidisoma silvae]|uniref:Response regulator n=1 Tax=Acidisoma silvae TaxID=2802396 RepID=A0A963YW01_9PROT|nr:response regulator [Acidisoma silvae]MCB8877377.1 response regulator [Acidisoma silvae]
MNTLNSLFAFPRKTNRLMVRATTGKIAVVDDDVAVLESYQFMLELAGFQVAAFTSALEFLEATAAPPRCMILDQHMPLMTGLELAQTLREQQSQIPIMLITAVPTPAIRARAAELGITEVLEKPPNEEELLQFVTVSLES